MEAVLDRVAEQTEDELTLSLEHWETIKAHAAANQVAILIEADRRQLPLSDGCRNLTDWAVWRLDVSRDTARRLVSLARRLPQLPLIAKLFAEGEIGTERAALIASVATGDNESDVIDRTAGLDLAGLTRWVGRHKRITRHAERAGHNDSYLWLQPSLDESWWRISGGVTGGAGATITEALKKRADEFPKEEGSMAHRQALALETICQDSLGTDVSGAAGESGADISVFIDLDLAGATEGEAGVEIAFGPRVGPDTLEELACGGKVRVIGLENGKPVVTSPSAATIPRAVRAFVAWRDGKCRAQGCSSRYRLQPHHIGHRALGGSHDPDNLISLCWYHHHVVVHRRGFVVRRHTDGSIRLVRPAASRSPP